MKSRVKLFWICVCLTFVICHIPKAAADWGLEVNPSDSGGGEQSTSEIHMFSDDALEDVIRSTLNMKSADVYVSDLEKITVINAEGKGISRIDDLRVCTNLQALYLNDNDISDIGALRACTKLEILELRRNPISDIEPISKLTGLRILVLRATNISGIGDLKDLTNLTDLLINHLRITDISPISGMEKMKNLYLNNNPELTDLGPVKGLKQLEVVDIRKCSKLSKSERKWLKDTVPSGCKIVS